MKKILILGVKISRIGFGQAIEIIEGFLQDGKKHLVTTPYAESIVAAQKDEEFRTIINQSDLAVPDGGSLLAAAEFVSYQLPKNKIFRLPVAIFLGLWVGLRLAVAPKTFKSLKERVSGTDLMISLCRLSAEKSYRVYLFGATKASSEAASRKLLESFPGLVVASSPGPSDLKRAPVKEVEAEVGKINQFRPDLLFVAFKPFEQEKWLRQNMARINAKVFMAVGGAFDMISGKTRRAPQIIQRLNLEWLWRLLIDPSRFRRILNAVIVFPWLVFREKLI